MRPLSLSLSLGERVRCETNFLHAHAGEWEFDCQGRSELDERLFSISFFQLVDTWSTADSMGHHSVNVFVKYLCYLMDRIADFDPKTGDVKCRWTLDPIGWRGTRRPTHNLSVGGFGGVVETCGPRRTHDGSNAVATVRQEFRTLSIVPIVAGNDRERTQALSRR